MSARFPLQWVGFARQSPGKMSLEVAVENKLKAFEFSKLDFIGRNLSVRSWKD